MMDARTSDLVSEAERMMRLFPANNRAHAYPKYETAKPRESDGKLEVKYVTVRKPVTLQTWQEHLKGNRHLTLGLANEAGLSSVSCVDIDDYNTDLVALAKLIFERKLPFVIARSKSRGGAHVFAFHDKPIQVNEAISVAEGMTRMLGLEGKKIEYFPKPLSSDPTKLVKGLNMPYFGSEGLALKRTGAEMTSHEFLGFAEKNLTTAEQRAVIMAASTPKKRRPAPEGEGRRHAEKKLKQFCEELSQAPRGTRNELLYGRSKDMGKMITPGWIDRAPVEREILAAIAHWDEQPKCRDTMKNGIDDGMRAPPPDIGGQITEDGTALEFAERHANDLRFDNDAGRWYRWNSTHWKHDRTQFAFSEARDLVRELSQDQPQRIKYVTSRANFAGNVERFAKSDQRLGVTQEVWDQDPFLIGTPGGTVNLKTGELRKSQPGDMITRITAVTPAENADCPMWFRFLSEATSDDPELIKFLQVVCGYAMTGDTSEQLLVFIYGPGGNGKSVFLTAIGGILGDYHTAAAMETFTESLHDRHPTDLAALKGARLVTCAETSEGRAWAETRIKQLTGGDPITARFMRRDFFTYQPTFQLLIVGNHKPKLRNITEAMRRRLAIIPFVNAPVEPDHELGEKLRAEWPGILRWMIEGCLAWQKEKGIKRPEIVVEATKEYFNEQDLLGQWIEERLERAPGSNLSTVKAYESFVTFAAHSGERSPGDIKWFHEQMDQHNFNKRKSHGNRVYKDVRFKPDKPELI
ncbi:phage/plasmid primase, P4 family [Bradyrhizobium elkanii]|uniref:phage/plasmid primase, P4 family n=1 Tax=Bradyrhizobium elkanii TaxID=29448 RepID=UPI0021693501|nr:phage/plasmid primase, P4 family [Bradyrhizobium elkanii]MCS3521846.1 P4 family phage/plasmid primase-like protein [Bradyrhizobium elkanii]MCS4069501.1 P4 family phage/plasmid primase-like protein [Bradyrhizobium elkanii]MCS4076131.1 P4 family phage/plasmid primase-like protein [Bradyrhizobium elkanii]MDH6687735.1 P4 family phage/plasmid primase-like protein [Bradyrhizobium elkanii]